MKKVFYNKDEVMEMCGYSVDEFKEYFGEKCVGIVSYEEVDEVLFEISVMFDNGRMYYEYSMCGDSVIEYDGLREFENKWVNN